MCKLDLCMLKWSLENTIHVNHFVSLLQRTVNQIRDMSEIVSTQVLPFNQRKSPHIKWI